MQLVTNARLFQQLQVRDKTQCVFFSFCILAKISNFFFYSFSRDISLSLYIILCIIVYSSHGCYYHFWHFFTCIHAHNHVIVSLIIFATSIFFLLLLFSLHVCVSLTLTVVQYERSIVRHHHHHHHHHLRLHVSPTPTVLANKHNTQNW